MKLGNNISAIVTGGASGLGEATARALSARGVKVALFDINEEKGEAVAKAIGGRFFHVDVTDETSIDTALEGARAAHGQERILINCAGIVFGMKTASRHRETGEVRAHAIDAFAKVIAVNLTGAFAVAAKSAAGMMQADPVTDDGTRGVIIHTSSVAADEGQIGQAAYAASKGAIKALALPMARDLSRDGIRVNAIQPGLFETPMFDVLPEEVRESLGKSVPFPQRLGHADEYAALALHICENEMINGAAIRLDGAVRLAPR
jgi:NAD(P)-dependent dehydrogenase (short-subunit alcohol dehydrogenase family)